jgi:ABC-2 type transport system ATP-binding protein
MIELENFTKSYNKKSFAVENISFSVEKGSVTALLGVNGSGKSTILKAVTGFHYPTGGNIYLSDNINSKISILENREKVMEYVGYVPEIFILPQDLYVCDFLDYCANLHNLKDKKDRIDYVVNKCSLQKVYKDKIKTLSKGYKQRLSFAQAIIHNPPNLVLDEPVSGLDPAQIIQLRNLIVELSKDKAILLSTHILQEVYSICSSIFIINKGKLAASGKEEDILRETKEESLEKAFLKLCGGSDE